MIRFLLLLFLPFWLFGQPSLRDIMIDEAQSDSARLEAAYQLSVYYRSFKPDSAIWFTNWEYSFAQQRDNVEHMAMAQNTKGIVYTMTDNFSGAIKALEESKSLYASLGDKTSTAKVQNNLGNLFVRKSDYIAAIEAYLESAAAFEELNDLKSSSVILGNIGAIYSDIEDFEMALKYLKKALALIEAIPDSASATYKLVNIGIVYQEMEDYPKALDYFERGMTYVDPNNLHLKGLLAAGIATSLCKLDQREAAAEQFKIALELNERVNNRKALSNCLISIGHLMIDQDLDSARMLGSQAMELVANSGNLLEWLKASDLMYKIHKMDGNVAEALAMLEQSQMLADSINMEDTKKELIRLELQQKHEQDIAEEKVAAKLFRIYAILGTLITASFFLIILQVRKMKSRHEREQLMNQIDLLKQKGRSKDEAFSMEPLPIQLDKEKLEQAIDGKLNPTDWGILNLLCGDPFMANKVLADHVSLSIEGTSSSLRKMYQLFKLSNATNKKVALVKEAIRLTLD